MVNLKTAYGGEMEIEEKYIKEGKSIAWLSYLGILVIIPVLTQKENPYTKFHIKQGLTLFIFSFAWSFLQFLFNIIPYFGFFINICIWIFLSVLGIIGIINSLQGKTILLPVIGQLGEKFKF